MDSITLNCQHCIKPFSCPGVDKYCTRLIRLPYKMQHLLSVTLTTYNYTKHIHCIMYMVFEISETKWGLGGGEC